MTQKELQAGLETFITQAAGKTATITDLVPLAGGTSHDTWLVTLMLGDEEQRLVLRRDLTTTVYTAALEREQEYQLLQAAYDQGVQVPRPRWYSSDASILGAPFLLMDYVGGLSTGRQVVQAPELESARSLLPAQMAEQLARIHQMDYAALDFLHAPRSDYSPAQEAVAQIHELLDSLQIESPVLEFGLRWAAENAPACDHLTLIHGDFRLGNLIVGPEGLNAIIDWEFAHQGDPLEELAYPCMRDWRFGEGHLRLGGIADREPFIAAYEQHSGRTVDRGAVDWWEIMGNLRWGAVCLAQAKRHVSGSGLSVEVASLGRRSAEMQLEVLRLIEERGI